MAENLILAQVLVGISALETKADLDAVKNAVKDRREVIRNLGEEVVALARGNSAEVIRVNKERYDYSNVPPKDLPMAEKWYMAPRTSWKLRSAYHQWRVWNADKTRDGKDLAGYKGFLIIEKATGRSVSPTEVESEEDEEVGEGEEEDEEVGEEVTETTEEVGEEVTEATEAMAAVHV